MFNRKLLFFPVERDRWLLGYKAQQLRPDPIPHPDTVQSVSFNPEVGNHQHGNLSGPGREADFSGFRCLLSICEIVLALSTLLNSQIFQGSYWQKCSLRPNRFRLSDSVYLHISFRWNPQLRRITVLRNPITPIDEKNTLRPIAVFPTQLLLHLRLLCPQRLISANSVQLSLQINTEGFTSLSAFTLSRILIYLFQYASSLVIPSIQASSANCTAQLTTKIMFTTVNRIRLPKMLEG